MTTELWAEIFLKTAIISALLAIISAVLLHWCEISPPVNKFFVNLGKGFASIWKQFYYWCIGD